MKASSTAFPVRPCAQGARAQPGELGAVARRQLWSRRARVPGLTDDAAPPALASRRASSPQRRRTCIARISGLRRLVLCADRTAQLARANAWIRRRRSGARPRSYRLCIRPGSAGASAQPRQPHDDRIPGERSSRRTPSRRCQWRRRDDAGPRPRRVLCQCVADAELAPRQLLFPRKAGLRARSPRYPGDGKSRSPPAMVIGLGLTAPRLYGSPCARGRSA